MIPLPCLAPYLIDLERPDQTAPMPNYITRRQSSGTAFGVENVFCFAPQSSVGRFDLLSQTLQIIYTTPNRVCLRPLCEADYAIPKSLGSMPRLGTRVNCIADSIDEGLRKQGWGNSHSRTVDMQALEMSGFLRLYRGESMHDWLERIKCACSLFDGLADAGFDVMPHLEQFLAEAR